MVLAYIPASNKSFQAVLIRSFKLQTAQTVLDTVTLGQRTVNIPLIPAGCGTAVWLPPSCSRILPVLSFPARPPGQTPRQGLTAYMSSCQSLGTLLLGFILQEYVSLSHYVHVLPCCRWFLD